MDFKKEVAKVIYMVDYPLKYDQYGNQLVIENISAASEAIYRILYTRKNILPSLPNLFVDIETWKHMLDKDENISDFKNTLQTSIAETLPPAFQPQLDVIPDYQKRSIDIYVRLTYNGGYYMLRFNDASNKDNLSFEINFKPFDK